METKSGPSDCIPALFVCYFCILLAVELYLKQFIRALSAICPGSACFNCISSCICTSICNCILMHFNQFIHASLQFVPDVHLFFRLRISFSWREHISETSWMTCCDMMILQWYDDDIILIWWYDHDMISWWYDMVLFQKIRTYKNATRT